MTAGRKGFCQTHPYVVLDAAGKFDSRWSNIGAALDRAELIRGRVDHPALAEAVCQ